VQAEVEALTAAGVNKILLLNHSQSIRGATELAAQLNGVDVIVTGLGDEALANDGDLLIPGHESQVIGPYPVLAQDAGGRDVPVVTGVGGYNYVGRLVASFDATGNITSIGDTSGPVRVMGGSHADASAPHKEVQALVDEPVKRFLGDQGHTVVARLDVPLEAHRPNIRIQETNGGNLVADAVRWQAAQAAAGFGAPQPTVAVQNAGGIRTPKLIPAGSLTRLDVNTMLPFPNFVSIVAGLSAADLKAVVENAVSRVEFADGRFPHISGFSMVYDPEGSPRVVDENGKLTSKGARVVSITLDDGTPIVEDGQVVPGAPAINVASVDFLARGGDLYPYAGFEFTRLGVRYNDALANYIRDGLNGMITAAQYPEGGSGRARTLAEAAKP
jgi:5'-nucleotidase